MSQEQQPKQQELGVLGQKLQQKKVGNTQYVKEVDEEQSVNPQTGEIDSQAMQNNNNSVLQQLFPSIKLKSVNSVFIFIFLFTLLYTSYKASLLELPDKHPLKNQIQDTFVTVEMGCTLFRSGGRFTPSLFDFYGFWRLITSIFVHGDLVQFLMNVFTILLMGYQIEEFQSQQKYLVCFTITGFFSNLFSQWVHHDQIYSGACQSIFGMMGTYVFYMKEHYSYMGEGRKVQKKNFLYVLGSAFLIFFLDDKIDIWALPVSLVIGFIISQIAEREYYNHCKGIILILLVFILYCGGVGYLIKNLDTQNIEYPCQVFDDQDYDFSKKQQD